MPSSSPTAESLASNSKLMHGVAEFLIRRRILISGILFTLVVGYTVAYGPKPHDLINFRDPITVLGVLSVILGVALRSWAAGILRKNAELTTTGPYGLIRNPLYVGSFLMIFGFWALIGHPLNFLIILGPLAVIYVVKVRQEEALLSSRFSDQWPAYAKSTPRFVPRPKRVDLKAPWKVSQWLLHREYQALLASIAALVAIQIWRSM